MQTHFHLLSPTFSSLENLRVLMQNTHYLTRTPNEGLCTWLSKSAVWDLSLYWFLLVSRPMIQPKCGGIKNMKSHVLPSISKINLQWQDTYRPTFIGWWSINTSWYHFIFQLSMEIKRQCIRATNILWWGYQLPGDLSLNEKTWRKHKN